MIEFNFSELTIPERYKLMTRAVAPRPIAFVSTLGADGKGNLAPFSFFNIGGANPPSCVICPLNNRDGIAKDTLLNIEEMEGYVINVVTRPMAEKMNQASYSYERGVDEFDKSGFTRVPSKLVAPPRVAESPVQIECKLFQIVRHGEGALASSYIIGEMLLMHVDDTMLTEGQLDNTKLDLIGRLGADWYCGTKPENLFLLPRPMDP